MNHYTNIEKINKNVCIIEKKLEQVLKLEILIVLEVNYSKRIWS